jgi:hypothetical protein
MIGAAQPRMEKRLGAATANEAAPHIVKFSESFEREAVQYHLGENSTVDDCPFERLGRAYCGGNTLRGADCFLISSSSFASG